METTFNDNTTARDEWLRQGTESSEQNRTLSGGEWQCLNGARQQGTRSDGWQRIGWRQGTAADGGLRWQWRDSMADIKAYVCTGRLKADFRILTKDNLLRKDGQVSPKKWNGNVWNCGTVSQIWRLSGLTCVRYYSLFNIEKKYKKHINKQKTLHLG